MSTSFDIERSVSTVRNASFSKDQYRKCAEDPKFRMAHLTIRNSNGSVVTISGVFHVSKTDAAYLALMNQDDS